MKKVWIIAMVVFGAVSAQAQVSISVNIGNQPAWAPEGYDEAQYYYIPDMDIYYDVPAHQFLYPSGGSWIRTATLPPAYRRYDLYKVHKVALNDRDAYRNHDRDQREYAQFRGKYDQHPIRDSRDGKYTNNRNNWKSNRFNGQTNKDDRKGNDRHRNNNHPRGR